MLSFAIVPSFILLIYRESAALDFEELNRNGGYISFLSNLARTRGSSLIVVFMFFSALLFV